MPVLWQPTVQTSYGNLDPDVPATYTLNIITTQIIDKGVFLRFQIYDGQANTYSEALSGTSPVGVGLHEFDLVITTAIPAGTVCVVSITQTSTQLYGFTGTQTYASGGASVPAVAFGRFRSCLCFAFVPTPAGSWFPCRGQPMFAIGFNHPAQVQGGTGVDGNYCIQYPPVGTEITAPNFPDQYASVDLPEPRWTFEYEVVYPISAPYLEVSEFGVSTEVCRDSVGIKYLPLFTDPLRNGYSSTATLGSWTTARLNINQPWTVLKDNYTSVSRWAFYDATINLVTGPSVTASVGPFVLSAMSGQLVPVYWRPKYKNINTDGRIIEESSLVSFAKGGPAAIGLLVTSPLLPGQNLYFTKGEYDARNGGFGFRTTAGTGASFVDTNPSFVWVVGSYVIEAGTVLYIGNIGTPDTYIQNAHDSTADVGHIVHNILTSEDAVTSLICMGVWDTTGNGSSKAIFQTYFVCAALSEQYAGNLPPLSPCITIHKTHFVGQVIYGMGRTFDNKGLPATVQAPLINSSTFTQLAWGTAVTPSDLPSFVGMKHFSW